MFQKYDDLNASVQENISAIRVVKAFVREDYENKKFAKASQNLYRLFVKAEGLLAFNNPAMMIAVYFCIIIGLLAGRPVHRGRHACPPAT